MSELPWSKFFWSDWESDQGLRLCSLAAQGLWMRMLCVCAKGDPRGYLAINGNPLDSTGVARLCGIPAEEAESLMEELQLNGVFSRDRRGWIYNRRMVKDAKKSATGKKHANKRWSQVDKNKEKKSQPNGVASGAPTTQKPEARNQIYSDTDVSDADGVDFAKAIFDRGVAFLCRHGVKESQARSFIGKLRKDHSDAKIFEAFSECAKQGVVDPISWLTRSLNPKPNLVNWEAL